MNMDELPLKIAFKRVIKGSLEEIIIPEEFIKDFHFSSDNHLMVMIRVIGTDSKKVIDFLKDSEGELFTLETTATDGKKASNEFILKSIYMDEGPPPSVDINTDVSMVRTILDFKMK
jgi:hypothetical protein